MIRVSQRKIPESTESCEARERFTTGQCWPVPALECVFESIFGSYTAPPETNPDSSAVRTCKSSMPARVTSALAG